MLPVALADPLWWVAARLRRILTGLLVLALALGAHGQAAVAAPPSGAPLGNTPFVAHLTSQSPKALVPSVASTTNGSATRAVASPVDVSASPAAVSTAAPTGSAITAAVSALPPVGALAVPPPDPLVRQVSGSDERAKAAYQAAPPGQRAPPAS